MSDCEEIVLDHLDRLTDSTGLIQHAIYSIPRRESGYTTDDNARALRLCARLWSECPDERMLARVTCYLSFLEHARCPVRGFHNFLSFQRDWLDASGTGDCQGQAVLALAEVLASPLPDGYRALARELINAVLPALADLRSLRAQAYIIQAWSHLRSADVDDIEAIENVARLAAERLVECYYRSQRPDWPWFESRMTYANAVLPHALFNAAERPHEDCHRQRLDARFRHKSLFSGTPECCGNRKSRTYTPSCSTDIPPIRSSRRRTGPIRQILCSTPGRVRWGTKRFSWCGSK